MTVERVGVRELRAHLKEFIAGDSPLVVGNAWHTRCIIVPVGRFYRWDKSKARITRKEVEAKFAGALAELFRD